MMQTKDFKGQDLRGKSFKNQDLTGADFSDCDLRGVDFSFANLTDAKFCNARMGRTLKAGFVLMLLHLLLGGLTGALAAIGNPYMMWSGLQVIHELSISGVSKIVFIVVCSLLFAFVMLLAIDRKRLAYVAWYCILIVVFVVVRVITVSDFTGSTAIAGFATVSGIIAIAIAVALSAVFARIEFLIVAVAIATVVYVFVITANNQSDKDIFSLSSATGTIYIILGFYLGKRATKKEEVQLIWLRNWSVKIACFRGTQFAFATLQDADFSHADLKYARFKDAKMQRCRFQQAKNHHLALTNGTSVETRKIRDLVIDGIITDKNFATLDLRGLDFSGEESNKRDLQDFDFSHANLSGANLSHTQLTGATLESWNIDTETRLDDIECRYYYYLENGAKKRMPPEGEEYGAGEFTRIFQKIANTIDFIAHNEIQLAAIKLSVEQVRVESGNDDIRVQAIEEKDGFIVVKVTAPKTEDRGVLYHEVNVLKQDYETKIQGLMAEKQIQIGKIDVLKEQLKEQRDDFLAAIKEGRIINATNYVEGNMSGGNMAGQDILNNP